MIQGAQRNRIAYSTQLDHPQASLVILQGDHQDTLRLVHGVADGVLLGLLPDATQGLALAIQVAKPKAWLHVHALHSVDVSDHTTFQPIAQLLLTLNVKVLHYTMHKIKNYAPRIQHVVFDIHLLKST